MLTNDFDFTIMIKDWHYILLLKKSSYILFVPIIAIQRGLGESMLITDLPCKVKLLLIQVIISKLMNAVADN